jgi:hypothetical protein
MRNYWTKELAFEKALEFNNKKDFKQKNGGAFEFLRKGGFIGEACEHMNNINHVVKWTYDKCKEDAKNYQTKIEYREKNYWGYLVSKKNGWLDDITSHMIKYKHTQKLKWSKEICQVEALKYQRRIDFYKNSRSAYSASNRNNWLDEVCSHMSTPNENKFKWNKDKCQKIAVKYNHRKEFQLGNRNAYYSAFYNGWLNEICQHMIPIGDRKHKCIYAYEFSDNHVYVGLTYDINVRDKSRRHQKNDAVVLYINKTGLIPKLIQLTDYVPVDEAIRLEKQYLCEYVNNCWIALNRAKTGGIGGYNLVWNFNRVKKITSEYDTLESFMNEDKYLYDIAKKNEWIDSLFPCDN